MTAVAGPPRVDRPPTQPRSGDQLLTLPLAQLRESKWNPRKHFDPEKLEDMADSLRKGQLAPIIVRPWAVDRDRWLTSGSPLGITFEIGAGHRRFRAAPMAGLTGLLAIVRDLDDVAFLELLTIENKQRDDVEPLDEANGFKLLMEKAGYDVVKLANRIGLSKEYVYGRLKLLNLIPAAKKLLEQKVITAGHAILLARLSPTDQKRAIGDLEDVAESGEYAAHRVSLLLRPDNGADGELSLHDQVKPVSVREFKQAIEEKIRATPERVDPFLFPESAAALEVAKEEKLSVIHITRGYRVDDEARDEKIKTYGSEAWERADGGVEAEWGTGRPKKSKTCDFSRYGFVVTGAGQGEVFRVCINKQKCKVHWPEHVKRAEAAKKRAKTGAPARATKKADSHEREQERRRREETERDAERARWTKARPAILKALAEKLAATPAGPRSNLADDVLAACIRGGKADTTLARGRSAEDFLRHAAFQLYADDVGDLAPGYYRHAEAVKNLRAVGIDAAKIVDQFAPKSKSEKKQPAKKAAKKKAKK